MYFSFAPDPSRTDAIDAAIRAALADSVVRVAAEMGRAGLDWPGDVAGWGAALRQMRAAPPRLWAVYHALVQAVLRGDLAGAQAEAAALMQGLPALPGQPGRVITLGAPDLGPGEVDRYAAVIDNDPAAPLDLVPVPAAEVARLAGLVAPARSLLAQSDPALLDEIDTLGHEIVLASGTGPRSFGGAATVFLWGAVVINPALVPDRITLVESLAHETAHALLFGLTLGADLTLNGPDERYGSPLRADPRPIEGIVHATYVLARMIRALEPLATLPDLSPDERALVAARLHRNRANYLSGLAVVDAHARFTEAGAAIMEACRQAMAGAGAMSTHVPIDG